MTRERAIFDQWEEAQIALHRAVEAFAKCEAREQECRKRLIESLPFRKPLTIQERRVLALALDDRQNKEIAKELNISVRTVKFHMTSLMQKFGVTSRKKLSLVPLQIKENHATPSCIELARV